MDVHAYFGACRRGDPCPLCAATARRRDGDGLGDINGLLSEAAGDAIEHARARRSRSRPAIESGRPATEGRANTTAGICRHTDRDSAWPQGHERRQPGDDPHLQGRVELELWMQKDDALRAVRHLSHLLMVGQARAEAAARATSRRPKASTPWPCAQIHHKGRWPRSLEHRLPQHLRPRAWSGRARYILVHGGCTSIGCFAMTNPSWKRSTG